MNSIEEKRQVCSVKILYFELFQMPVYSQAIPPEIAIGMQISEFPKEAIQKARCLPKKIKYVIYREPRDGNDGDIGPLEAYSPKGYV